MGYNFLVPTPFYHLSLAEDLLSYPGLSDTVRQFLHNSRAEFLFGNTAPDVQVVSGQPRQRTHFFSLPVLPGDPPGWERLLNDHPHLAKAHLLKASQLAFITGYLCHLQADWYWVNEIFAPSFGPRCTWSSFRERLYLHNVLRAYLDQRILPSIRSGMHSTLSLVEPDGWLPFVADRHLVQWRDLLTPQLVPGAAIQTVEVFASRQGISVPEFYALLESEERMREEVFVHLPLNIVDDYREKMLVENAHLITHYLAFIQESQTSDSLPVGRNISMGGYL